MKLRRSQSEKPRRPKAVEVLVLPEAEPPKILFDPDRDITPNEWQLIRQAIHQERAAGSFSELENYVLAAAADVLLHPKGPERFGLLPRQLKAIGKEIDPDAAEVGEFPHMSELIFGMATLKPDWTPSDLGTTQKQIQQFIEMVQVPRESLYGLEWRGKCMVAFPDALPPVTLSDGAWEMLKQEMEGDIFGEEHIDSTAFMSLAVPSRRADLQKFLTDRYWVQIRKLMDYRRHLGAWLDLAKMALEATLLAADRVEILGPGRLKIRLKPPPPPLRVSLPLPERPQI